MVLSFYKVLQETTMAGALLLLCAGSSASAGLFCEWHIDPVRPYFSPACQPNWGHYQTTWRQFGPTTQGAFCSTCQSNAGIGIQVPATSGAVVGSTPQMVVPPATAMPMTAQPMTPQPMTAQPIPDPAYHSNGQQSMSPMTAPQPVLTPIPVPQNSPVPAPRQPATFNPQPLNSPQPQIGGPQSTNPGVTNPLPLNMPPIPTQSSNQPSTGRLHLAGFPESRSPMPTGTNMPNRVFNGRLVYGRHGGPVPPYQQPNAVHAQPLIPQSNSSPQTLPPQFLNGQEIPTELPTTGPDATEPFYKRLFRLPRMFSGNN